MKRIVLGAVVLTGLAACDDPTRPAEPSITPPTAAVAAVERQFTIRDLGTLGGTGSDGEGINEQGEVVGSADLLSGERRAFLWRRGQGMRSLGTLGGDRSFAEDINDRSEVVGLSGIRPGSNVVRAFLWSQARGMRGLGTLGGENSFANAINNRGEVVGSSEIRNEVFRAFLWRPGRGMRSLGTLGGANSFARDVNNATQVVGFSNLASGPVHAFLWTARRGMEDLGTLGGTRSFAFGISQRGEVVGFSTTDAAGSEEAFLWTRAGGMRSLGTLGGQFFNRAFSVNTHRWVVGMSQPGDVGTNFLPFLWTPGGGMRRLPQPRPGSSGEANDLNEFGKIVGGSFITRPSGEAEFHALLWTPTAGPLVVAPTDEAAAPEIAAPPGGPRDARTAWCALGRKLGDWSRSGMAASKACLAR
jgi:probable HAF family extracellular repeat protein